MLLSHHQRTKMGIRIMFHNQNNRLNDKRIKNSIEANKQASKQNTNTCPLDIDCYTVHLIKHFINA